MTKHQFSVSEHSGSAIFIWQQILTCVVLSVHPSMTIAIRTPTPSHIVRTNAAVRDHSVT